MAEDLNASAGQAAAEPVQFSSTSQVVLAPALAPTAARHTVVLGTNASAEH
jgi:hypothetical protein